MTPNELIEKIRQLDREDIIAIYAMLEDELCASDSEHLNRKQVYRVPSPIYAPEAKQALRRLLRDDAEEEWQELARCGVVKMPPRIRVSDEAIALFERLEAEGSRRG